LGGGNKRRRKTNMKIEKRVLEEAQESKFTEELEKQGRNVNASPGAGS